uniref:Uncharacterized protein n=1 Tax=Ixodes ricinus TaxID=34613 RepID=A0A6B0UQI3_IXORI
MCCNIFFYYLKLFMPTLWLSFAKRPLRAKCSKLLWPSTKLKKRRKKKKECCGSKKNSCDGCLPSQMVSSVYCSLYSASSMVFATNVVQCVNGLCSCLFMTRPSLFVHILPLQQHTAMPAYVHSNI